MISTLVTPRPLHTTFPRLMQSNHNPGLIVLFSSQNDGTVVAIPHDEEIHAVADHSHLWDPFCFDVFDGDVSLRNEAELGQEEGCCLDDDGDCADLSTCWARPVASDDEDLLGSYGPIGPLVRVILDRLLAEEMKAGHD